MSYGDSRKFVASNIGPEVNGIVTIKKLCVQILYSR